MSLRQRLAALLNLRPAPYRTLLEELSARLQATAIDGVLKAGDKMPDFVLPDAQGTLVFSDDLLARGPLVVVFFRGDWCPFCTMTLAALNDVIADITAAGASLVALTPDTGDYATAAWSKLGLQFPVLSDVDSATALEFGTNYRVPDALRAVQEANGLDLAVRHGDGSWFLPMPATFIADRSGILRFSYASGDITDRLEPELIVAMVRDIASRDAERGAFDAGRRG
jgi:peroxiredoxin